MKRKGRKNGIFLLERKTGLPLKACRKSERIFKKRDITKCWGLPSHVSARDSKYHHGSNQFAAAVDSLKGLNSLIGEMF